VTITGKMNAWIDESIAIEVGVVGVVALLMFYVFFFMRRYSPMIRIIERSNRNLRVRCPHNESGEDTWCPVVAGN
jgi:hypothetical protein